MFLFRTYFRLASGDIGRSDTTMFDWRLLSADVTKTNIEIRENPLCLNVGSSNHWISVRIYIHFLHMPSTNLHLAPKCDDNDNLYSYQSTFVFVQFAKRFEHKQKAKRRIKQDEPSVAVCVLSCFSRFKSHFDQILFMSCQTVSTFPRNLMQFTLRILQSTTKTDNRNWPILSFLFENQTFVRKHFVVVSICRDRI